MEEQHYNVLYHIRHYVGSDTYMAGCCDRKNLLQKIFLFDHVEDSILDYAAGHPKVVEMQFEAGEVIYSIHDYQKSLGILCNGKAEARRTAGEKQVLLRTFQRADVFGAAALFAGEGQYVSDIVAVKPCIVLFLPQELVEDLMERCPRVAKNYIAFLSGRIRFLNQKIAAFTVCGAEKRLAGYLLQYKTEEPIVLPVSMSRLAQELDIGRASLYRAFDLLEKAGVLMRSDRQVTILDPQLLQQFGA